MAKTKQKEIVLPTEEDIEKKPKRRGLGARNKARGNEYECRIAKELRELGFTGVVTARSESKRTDNNKVDLIDTNKQLPFNIQLKRTVNTPQYFKIREESTVDPKSFVLIWNKQEKANVNFLSVGEAVIMDKETFYDLIKPYAKSDE